MDDMVEVVARAIGRRQLEREGQFGPRGVDEYLRDHWQDWSDIARAAIEAMREPTQAMILSGFIAGHSLSIASWKAMIDAALSKQTSANHGIPIFRLKDGSDT